MPLRQSTLRQQAPDKVTVASLNMRLKRFKMLMRDYGKGIDDRFYKATIDTLESVEGIKLTRSGKISTKVNNSLALQAAAKIIPTWKEMIDLSEQGDTELKQAKKSAKRASEERSHIESMIPKSLKGIDSAAAKANVKELKEKLKKAKKAEKEAKEAVEKSKRKIVTKAKQNALVDKAFLEKLQDFYEMRPPVTSSAYTLWKTVASMLKDHSYETMSDEDIISFTAEIDAAVELLNPLEEKNVQDVKLNRPERKDKPISFSLDDPDMDEF